jgi:hypothetical protein
MARPWMRLSCALYWWTPRAGAQRLCTAGQLCCLRLRHSFIHTPWNCQAVHKLHSCGGTAGNMFARCQCRGWGSIHARLASKSCVSAAGVSAAASLLRRHSFVSAHNFGLWPLLEGVTELPASVTQVGGVGGGHRHLHSSTCLLLII